jgi:hypothetical protein
MHPLLIGYCVSIFGGITYENHINYTNKYNIFHFIINSIVGWIKGNIIGIMWPFTWPLILLNLATEQYKASK